ncbi:MAG: hydrogenase maturation protease [Planctomycetota bacterium]
MKRVRIIALGNVLLSDEGASQAVLERLRVRNLPPGVELIDAGTPGLSLLHLLDGCERAVLIDCARMGEPPGSVRIFSRDQVRDLRPHAQASLHDLAVIEVLDLAERLSQPLPGIVIVGIEPGTVSAGMGLSPEVEAAADRAADEIARLLEKDP